MKRINWRERDLHCKWLGHMPSRILRREPIRRDVSPIIEAPIGKPAEIACVEIRVCERCRIEIRTAKP